MDNLETIVNQPQKKGFFRRMGNWVGGALLTGSLLLGAYLPGCSKDNGNGDTPPPPVNGCAIGWIGGGQNGWQTSSGAFSGSDYQSFDGANGVFVDSSGNIYVVEEDNNRVSKWDSSGNAIGWIGGGSNGWKTGSGASFGFDYQSFWLPDGKLFVDNGGNIYVADAGNDRISKWDSSGNAIGWIGGASNGWKTGLAPSFGSDYQSFNMPEGVFVDGSGNIYVAEEQNHRVSKWTSSGNAIGWIGGGSNGWKTGNGASLGSDYQSFYFPWDVFVDSNGDIYVADYFNNRVCKWDSSGNAIGWIGGGSNGWKTTNGANFGSDYQSFSVEGIFVKGDGNIYVADVGNNRISKWSSSGNAVGWIGGGSNGWKTSNGAPFSSDYQSFFNPRSIFVDANDNIYIADEDNNRISKWKD